MTTYAVPTLGGTFMLTKPPAILAYVLRYYFTAWKSSNDFTTDQNISLVDTLSRYQNNSQQVTGPIQQELTAEFRRIFPSAEIDVEVTAINIDGVRYNLLISPSVTMGGLTYTVDRTINVGADGTISIQSDKVQPSYTVD